MPASMARKFGTPAAAAWTGVFVLIATFAVINWGVGLVLDTMLHPPAAEVSEPVEPGEPASVVVDLPPPLTPKAAPAAVAPVPAAPVYAPQRSTRPDYRSYRHGWRSRRWHERVPEPTETVAVPAATPAASHSPSPTGLLIGGLPKRVAGSSGEAAVHKEPVAAALSTPRLSTAAPPAPAAPKSGPPAALSSAAAN